ncbi:plasmid partitioning protein RepB [uncultured Tateyamaria sp.]|uniref:plasmid partitioning protein RepB n=1 Tax=uncultured Tateyamaria sp. TaxID=455651 RepID=UPI002621B718|nr:plasmid partitioning protein RepB [uncultured Tateyamaria sp.]
MALDKNKTGIMAAISAATEGMAEPKGASASARAHRTLPKGTVGSVRAGLGGIQSIETSVILAWGPQDRLALTQANAPVGDDVLDLMESIKASGQQVPVLLRPATDRDGQFEVIYGRRRVMACDALGIPVKALIRTLDDGEALIAKGLENAGRQDLSFYERARFALAILAQGHSREEAQQALSISKQSLSQLERVARLIPDAVGVAIGPAHGAGRPKWMQLAAAFEAGQVTDAVMLKVIGGLPEDVPSDLRLQAALDHLARRGTRDVRPAERHPIAGSVIKSTKSAVTVTVKRAGAPDGFADWLDRNIDRLLEESYQTFKSEAGG